MKMKRPEGWECPWCGPNGVPVDFSLPEELRLCDECRRSDEARAPTEERKDAKRDKIVEQLQKMLLDHIRDFRIEWPGCEFAKAIVGNSILGALEQWGCNKSEEMHRAWKTVEDEKPPYGYDRMVEYLKRRNQNAP